MWWNAACDPLSLRATHDHQSVVVGIFRYFRPTVPTRARIRRWRQRNGYGIRARSMRGGCSGRLARRRAMVWLRGGRPAIEQGPVRTTGGNRNRTAAVPWAEISEYAMTNSNNRFRYVSFPTFRIRQDQCLRMRNNLEYTLGWFIATRAAGWL
jgi:hypothetical protein